VILAGKGVRKKKKEKEAGNGGGVSPSIRCPVEILKRNAGNAFSSSDI